MLFGFGSLFLIVLIAVYVVIVFLRRREVIKKSSSIYIAMTLSMVASAFFGLLSTQVVEQTFTIPLFMAVLFAICVGYITGKSFGISSLINNLLAGILGAMIGTTFGIMIYTTNNIVLIIDTLFVLFIFFILKWLNLKTIELVKTKKKNENKVQSDANNRLKSLTIFLVVVNLVLGIGIVFGGNQIHTVQIGQPQSQQAIFDEENDLQEATITLSNSGFSPKNTLFDKGIMNKVIIHVEPGLGQDLLLVSNELNINAILVEGDNIFMLNKPLPGIYNFSIESTLFEGVLTVE